MQFILHPYGTTEMLLVYNITSKTESFSANEVKYLPQFGELCDCKRIIVFNWKPHHLSRKSLSIKFKL